MAPILTIVGATGVQGGSVLEAALKSGLYSIRAITRSTSSAKAKELLESGVEVVSADLDSEESLIKAFEVNPRPFLYLPNSANIHSRDRQPSSASQISSSIFPN
tara:strand:+ start:221 stop:532 length:312 start_codon:yes stop_codon:yes gene_type:complete